MTSRYRWLLFTIFSMFCSLAMAAPRGHGVGNGADGYYFSSTGRTYVRDLFDRGLHESTMPVGRIESRLSLRPYPLLTSASGQRKMAQKLTELNRIIPGIANVLRLAIDTHEWQFVNTPIPIMEFVHTAIPGAVVVRIANRDGRRIIVDQHRWLELSAENQIAVILHECFEALLIPRLQLGGSYLQSNLKTRELVAAAFSQQQGIDAKSIFKSLMTTETNMPWDFIEDYHRDPPPPIQISIVSPRGRQSQSWNIGLQQLQGGSTRIGQRICESWKSRKNAPAKLRITAHLRPYDLRMSPYEAEFGTQLYSSIHARSKTRYTKDMIPTNYPDCLEELERQFKHLLLEI